jgi:molecular chaperone IbpA
MTKLYYTNPFAGLERRFIGFDEIFDEMLRFQNGKQNQNFPPHSIRRLNDDKYVIEMAIAGYGKEDLSIELEDKVLTVKGSLEEDETEYLYKGIANRAFTKSFTLADETKVDGATVKNGILYIFLRKVEPVRDIKKITITDNIPSITVQEPQQLNG